MKELAQMSQDTKESFTSEVAALVSDIQSQLAVYDQSEEQKQRILDLQARIHAGCDKVETLSKRVDTVRERIEDWERADKEWQERTRKRLKVLWVFISVIAVVLMFVYFGAQYASSSVDINKLGNKSTPVLAPQQQQQTQQQSGRPPMGSLLDNANSSKSAATLAEEVREELARRRDHEAVEQEVLRAFDEL